MATTWKREGAGSGISFRPTNICEVTSFHLGERLRASGELAAGYRLAGCVWAFACRSLVSAHFHSCKRALKKRRAFGLGQRDANAQLR